MKQLFALVTLVICIVGSSRVIADPILDQDYCSPDFSSSFWAVVGDIETISNIRQAQTFTVGVTGKLSRIEFLKWMSYAEALELRWTLVTTSSDGYPSDEVLASGTTLTPISTDAPIAIDIGADDRPDVVRGQQLAIQLGVIGLTEIGGLPRCEIAGNGGSFWPYYQFGTALTKSTSDEWVDHPGCDLFFRTYVDPVPEPSSILALLCGIGGLGGTIWKRKPA